MVFLHVMMCWNPFLIWGMQSEVIAEKMETCCVSILVGFKNEGCQKTRFWWSQTSGQHSLLLHELYRERKGRLLGSLSGHEGEVSNVWSALPFSACIHPNPARPAAHEALTFFILTREDDWIAYNIVWATNTSVAIWRCSRSQKWSNVPSRVRRARRTKDIWGNQKTGGQKNLIAEEA